MNVRVNKSTSVVFLWMFLLNLLITAGRFLSPRGIISSRLRGRADVQRRLPAHGVNLVDETGGWVQTRAVILVLRILAADAMSGRVLSARLTRLCGHNKLDTSLGAGSEPGA